MNTTARLRTAALLAVLAIAAAACSGAVADDNPGTTPVTGAPSQDEPVTDTSGEAPTDDQPVPGDEPDITYRPIEVEPTLPAEGYVPGGGELVAIDGNWVTIGFWMGVEDCYGVQRIDVAETDTKVNIDITVSARAADQVCIEIAEARSVTVELDAPLGGRVLEIGGVTLSS